MATESDIIDAVETRLGNIATASGYNFDPSIIHRDESIHLAAMDSQSKLPALLVEYGREGRSDMGNIDMPRVGVVSEMLPITIRGLVKDTGTGDSVTTILAKLHEDVKRALANHLPDDVDSVYAANLRGFTKYDNWGREYDVIDFHLEVFHEYLQTEIVAATSTALTVPTNISFSIASGLLTLTFTIPSAADSVTIYKNNATEESGYTATTWYDSDWTVNDLYRLGAVDSESNEEQTEWLGFPYYPNTSPEVEYYKQAWLLSTRRSGQLIVGAGAPEMLIEQRIRHILELERLDSNLLSAANYTVAGPLLHTYLALANLPLIHVEAISSATDYTNIAEDEHELTLMVHVYHIADREKASRVANKATVHRLVHNIRNVIARDYTIDGVANAYDTDIVSTTWPVDTERIGNILCHHGMVELTVKFRWPWQG